VRIRRKRSFSRATTAPLSRPSWSAIASADQVVQTNRCVLARLRIPGSCVPVYGLEAHKPRDSNRSVTNKTESFPRYDDWPAEQARRVESWPESVPAVLLSCANRVAGHRLRPILPQLSRPLVKAGRKSEAAIIRSK
jgi:hypothetical protein